MIPYICSGCLLFSLVWSGWGLFEKRKCSHSSMHQSQFSNIWISFWQELCGCCWCYKSCHSTNHTHTVKQISRGFECYKYEGCFLLTFNNECCFICYDVHLLLCRNKVRSRGLSPLAKIHIFCCFVLSLFCFECNTIPFSLQMIISASFEM